MVKFLIKKIESCSECPYCVYDPCYDTNKDSGYDCLKENKRIIDDWEWDNSRNPDRLIEKVSFIPIPRWCPLPNENI